MESTKKEVKTSPGNLFFNLFVMEGVYREIFSFIEENKEVFSFALSCKNLWTCFEGMLLRSSIRYYRLQKLNKPKTIIDNTFEIFSPNSVNKPKFTLEKDKFVASVEEFEERLKNEIFFEILGDVNRKHGGGVCMVSGGYMLKHFYKNHEFVDFPDYATSNLNPQDIDVFLLGENKEQILDEILFEMKKRFSELTKFVIYKCEALGLVNVEVRSSHFPVAKEIPSDIRSTERNIEFYNDYVEDKREYNDFCDYQEEYDNTTDTIVSLHRFEEFLTHKRTRSCFQFILHKYHDTPGDVFAFFDLDCCKLGYFPGQKSSLVCPLAFIRSIVTKINYVDLHHRDCCVKHFYRIRKYFRRTKIISTMQCEPLLSFYHTLDQEKWKNRDFQKFPKEVIVWQWIKQFGNIKSDDRYYEQNIVSSMKKVEQMKTLSKYREKSGRLVKGIESDNPYLHTSVGLKENWDWDDEKKMRKKRIKKKKKKKKKMEKEMRDYSRFYYVDRSSFKINNTSYRFRQWGKNVSKINLGDIQLGNLYKKKWRF